MIVCALASFAPPELLVWTSGWVLMLKTSTWDFKMLIIFKSGLLEL